MTNLPKSRQSDIVVQALAKELLIYDLIANKAYHLNETSMNVFQACADNQTFESLKKTHGYTEDLIYLCLDQLKDEGLVMAYGSKFEGVSRREAIRKVGLATMIALPIITGLVAPTAAQAQSAVTCNTGGTCGCILPIGSAATTCSGANVRFAPCGNVCVCEVSRMGCFNQGDGTELCLGGNCIPAA